MAEKLMRVLGWRMCRCHECQYRFFRLGASILSPSDASKMGRRAMMWVIAALGVLGCAFVVRMLIIGMADPGPSG
ncbi:MAG: hypothetical protein IT168_15585 [Bryobacterales bacterium]|nr:hypothetical protein [Bryobacterales bacterium]